MKLLNRDSIAKDIKYKAFAERTVWNFVFPNTQDGIKHIGGKYYSNKMLYELLYNNVKEKVESQGGKIKSIYINFKKRPELNYQTAEKFMGEILRKQLSLTFKIMVRNKYYEFIVKG